jgi:hypothetical protein
MTIASVLIGIGLFGIPELPKSFVPAHAVTDIREPSEEVKRFVAPIAKISTEMAEIDKFWLRQIYMNAARAVEADGNIKSPTILTTDGAREVHKAVLAYVWKGMAQNTAGKYEGLQAAVEKAMVEAIGLDAKPLNQDLRDRLVETFEAIAWAAQ